MANDAAESLEPYRDISGSGRAYDPWVRRFVLVVLGLLVLAALLNRFGQQPATSNAAAPSARLEVQSPENPRAGLIFQARFTIAARERLDKPNADPSAWLVRVDVGQLDRPRRGAGRTRATAASA